MKKKLAAIIVICMLAAMGMTACGSKETKSSSDKLTSTSSDEESKMVKGKYKISVSQFAQHGSLDNCREGFLNGLKEEGFEEGKNLTVDYQNANADTGTANQIAQSFAANRTDLICAIATPSAQSAFNAAMNVNIPVVYTAVTDPVAAELAKEDKMPTGNTTGTSDKLPVEEQLKLIRDVLPNAKTIGILYTTSEVNSETTIQEYKNLAGKYDFKIEAKGISNAADIPMAADDLLEKVDCLSNLTDNTVVSALAQILDKADAKKIPVFGSEIEQVKLGCIAAEGIDYIKLGEQTGKMAASILKGEKKASEMPFEVIQESSLYINTKAAENIEITIPKERISNAAEVFDTISEE